MKEIGEYLRKVREEKKISLKDVQEATKISMRYLEAIDRGDFNGIPGEVYRKGFLVNYANMIGLDGQEILQKYNDLRTNQEEQIRLAQIAREEEEKNRSKININWPREVYLTFVAVMIGTLIIVSFFAFSSYKQESIEASVVSDSKSVQPNHTEPTNAASTSEPKSKLVAPITVYAEFTRKVWVSVYADGDYLFGSEGFIYDPSTPTQLWVAQKYMVIETGNAGGLSLNFNGNDLGPLGGKGETKTIRLTPKGLTAP